jgi:lysophospholipase L1-like esterase
VTAPVTRSRTVYLLLALLAATVLVAYSFSPAESAYENTSKVKVVVGAGEPLRVTYVGDSLDAGLYATERKLGFHPLMVDAWRADGPVSDTPLNSLGGTTERALRNSDLPRGQQLIVVELGTNDVVRTDHRAFRRDYGQLVDRLREASPEAGLLCVGPWRPRDTAERFDVIIKDICEGNGGVFRSLSDLYERSDLKGPSGEPTESGQSDSFHPNDLGHRAIADRLLGAVTVNRTS